MRQLPAPWALLTTLSGRFDPWPLIERLGGCEAVGRAGAADLLAAGLPLDVAARLGGQPGVPCPCSFAMAGEDDYPAALRGLPYAPPVVFFEGHPDAWRAPLVTIVGTRRCSAVGRRVAAEIARAVCLAGGTVVSGMAIGIDSAAHFGALERGRTIAVLGQGLAAPMAAGAARLRARIVAQGGAVLSELLPSQSARAFTFLNRNRILAGLARATVVVEASHRSGALSTARHAIEAGRELLAVPWSYDHEAGAGCLDLIERGQAAVVRGPRSVLEASGLAAVAEVGAGNQGAQEHALLLEGLDRGCGLEQLAERGGMTLVQALALLAELEVAGLVRRLPGQRFERARS